MIFHEKFEEIPFVCTSDVVSPLNEFVLNVLQGRNKTALLVEIENFDSIKEKIERTPIYAKIDDILLDMLMPSIIKDKRNWYTAKNESFVKEFIEKCTEFKKTSYVTGYRVDASKLVF